jgi:hypothetical protein
MTMDPSSQAFIDYALPDWASLDKAITSMALGEEGASELLGWQDGSQEFPTHDGGYGSAPTEPDWTVTTLAIGEEAGDAGLLADPITGSDLIGEPFPPVDGFAPTESTLVSIEPTIIDCTGGLFPGCFLPVFPQTGEPTEPPDAFVEPVFSLPNLAITQVKAASVASAGDQFIVSWTYSSSGITSLPFAASLCVVTYSQNDIYGDEDDAYITTLYGGFDWSNPASVDPVTSSQSIYIPAAYAGVGNLFFRQDGFNYLEEFDEADNIVMHGIEVVLPNLSLDAAVAPSQVVSGQQVETSWKVTNHGDLALGGSSYQNTVVFSSNDIYGDEDDVLIFIDYSPSWNSDAIQPGESRTYTQSFSIASTLSGDGYLFFSADGFNTLPETIESDNVLMQAFSILQPDLAIADVVAPATVSSGDQIQLSWSVVNQSDVVGHVANNFDSIIFSVNDIYGDDDDFFLADSLSFKPIDLTAFGTQTFSHSLHLPNDYVGDGYLFFKLDSGELINETNETNNLYSQQISILNKNVTITSISTVNTADSGSCFNLSLEIRNDGESAVNTFNPDQIVFSPNAILGDEDDSLLFSHGYAPYFPYHKISAYVVPDAQVFSRCGTVILPPQAESLNLQPGESTNISFSVYIPSYLFGAGYLFVKSSPEAVNSVPIEITPQPAEVYTLDPIPSYWLRSTLMTTSTSVMVNASIPQQATLMNPTILIPEGLLSGDQVFAQVFAYDSQPIMPLGLAPQPASDLEMQPSIAPSLSPSLSGDAQSSQRGLPEQSTTVSDQPTASFSTATASKPPTGYAVESIIPIMELPIMDAVLTSMPTNVYQNVLPQVESSASTVSVSSSSLLLQRTGVAPIANVDIFLDYVVVKDPLSGLILGKRATFA